MSPLIYFWLLIAAVVLTVLVVSRFARRLLGTLITVLFAIGVISGAIFTVALLMNDVALYESPGTSARIVRFVTVARAATSDKGLGSAPCEADADASPPATESARIKKRAKPNPPDGAQSRTAAASAVPIPAAAPTLEAGFYPELVQRGYPGIPRATLFKLAQETIGSLGGWKIVDVDSHNLVLTCVYTSRVLRFEDAIMVRVTRRSEVSLCSHSKTAGRSFPLSLFGGDFGANIGHIKEFYTAMEPRVDAVYAEAEKGENASR